ncbi:MAG: DMT family transporter [Burkholderiales bacterium]
MTRANLVAGLAWITLSILCWAPMFSVAKRTLPYLDAFALGTVRYLVAVLLLVLLLAAVEGRGALRYEGKLLAASAFGLVGITGFNLFVWIGLMYTAPEHASIILALQTPLTGLAVWAVRAQRPAVFTLGCVALAIAGVLLVVTKGEFAVPGGSLLGDLLVLAGAVSWVIYTLAAGYFAGWSPLRLTVLTCIPALGGLVLANIAAIAVGWASFPTAAALGSVWWQLLYFSICTVVLGALGFNNAVRRLGPLNTMLMLNVIPISVFGIEAALGRSFAAAELAGAAVVIAALVANNLYLRGTSMNAVRPPKSAG